MPAIKYDVTDVEAGGGGEQPQPGLYKGRIVKVTHRDKKANGDAANDLEVVASVGSDYAFQYTYIQLDNPATKWKLREFTDAMELPAKGQIDEKVLAKLKDKPVNIKIVADTDLEGGYRGRIKNLFKPGEGGEAAEASDNGASPTDETYTAEDLAGWDVDDLKQELSDRGLTLTGRFSAQKAIDAILEDQNGVEPEDPDPNEGEVGAGSSTEVDPELAAELSTDAEHYTDWTDEEIKQFIEDLGIAGNLTGRKTRAKMIEHITGYAEQVGGGGGEDGGEAPTDDYDEWPDEELTDEIKTRNEQGGEIKLTGRKTREKMIAALRADDANEPF